MKTSKKVAKKVVKKVAKKTTTKVAKKVKAAKTPKVQAPKKLTKTLTPKQISDMAVESLVISMNQQFQKIDTQDEANLIEYITFTTLGDKILGQFGKKVFNQYVKDIMEDFKDTKK
ncbi:MAG: hypothetical protein Q7U04_15120 [Bacteriovorax sp.]|nr:hypothetical protein [Bacteriovorax sp.]